MRSLLCFDGFFPERRLRSPARPTGGVGTACCAAPLAILPLRRLRCTLRWSPKGCNAAFVRMQKRRRRHRRHTHWSRHWIRARRQRAVHCSREATVERGRGAPPAGGRRLLRAWSALSCFRSSFSSAPLGPSSHAGLGHAMPNPATGNALVLRALISLRAGTSACRSRCQVPRRVSSPAGVPNLGISCRLRRPRSPFPRLFKLSRVWRMRERRAGCRICLHLE
jgi:hypothetical protein